MMLNPERVDPDSTANPIPVLHLSPLAKDAPKVLDVGTGTGLWAINVGELCCKRYQLGLLSDKDIRRKIPSR